MKNITRWFCVVLMLALALTGCGQPAPKNNNQESSNKKISVVATIFPQYDFVRAIAGDNVDISMLLPPGAESHSFEPTPQDIIRIQNCDIFIYVGGESDQWVEAILSGIDTSKMTIITLMSCVQTVEEEIVEGMQNEDDAEDSEPGNSDEPEYDEHVWTSPLNAKMIVEKISSALCEADTANAKSYQDNTAAYLAQLDNLDAKFKAVVSEASRTELIFGDRFPFRYFVDEYGLKYYAAFPGCAAETEASPATIKFLIDKINEDEIPVVFHIEMSNEQVANTISEATGAKVLLLHACHNISQSDFSSGKTYLELMTANAIALKEALG